MRLWVPARTVASMGKNAKRRRDAKLAGRAPMPTQAPPRRGDLTAAFGALTGTSTAVPGSAFRRSCDECGSTNLKWMSPLDLAATVAESERGEIVQAVEFLGESAEAWRCANCGKWGIFGDTHFEGF